MRLGLGRLRGAAPRTGAAAAPAIVVAALVLLPFLGKAFTVDDTVFLFAARHALSDPLHPTAFEMVWNDRPERVSAIAPTGPVMPWLLTPTIAANGAEWVAHLTQFAILCVGLLATVSLALRLGVPPPWAAGAGLLVACAPAVLGMAGTAMPDVPALSLGVLGIERLVAWSQDRRTSQGIAAGFLLGLAPLARTHLVLLPWIGAILVAGALAPRAQGASPSGPALRLPEPESTGRSRWVAWIPVVGATATTVALLLLTADRENAGSLAGAAASLSSLAFVPSNLVAFTTHWALALPLAIPWVLLHRERLARRWPMVLASTAAAAVLLRVAHGGEASYPIAIVAGVGAAALADLLWEALRRRDQVDLALGAWLLLSVPALVYLHFPSKYLVPSMPAAAILLARAMAERPRAGRAILAAVAALGIGLGIAILRADAAFADVGRIAARSLIAPEVQAGRRVWYVGHWGFQWYADQAGAQYLTSTPPHPSRGDRIAASLNSDARLGFSESPGLRRIGRVEERRPGGRIMSPAAGAGFFSNALGGYLPWGWGDDVLEAVDLWALQ